MEYKNPTPVAVTLVPVEDSLGTISLLGITRGITPFIGEDALPSGYVDEMESIEMAAARELKEETGIETKPEDWRLKHSAITPRNIVLVFCELKFPISVKALEGFVPNAEVQKLVLLNQDSKLCFPLHQEALTHVRWV